MLKTTKQYSSKNNIAKKRTKKGIVTVTYSHQKQHSKIRGHNPPEYTKQELKDWLFSQPLFHKLYDNWERTGYQKKYKPSVDRKDDYIGYTMDNIQLMTWGENDSKGRKDVKNGINRKSLYPVMQYTKEGVFIKEFRSATEANKQTGVNRPNIITVCKGDRSHAGGYKWAYK